MTKHYELNSHFFLKTWKEVFVLAELGFQKASFFLDYNDNPSAKSLNEILGRMDVHIDEFIINNKFYYVNCVLQSAKESPFMYDFLSIVFGFKHLYNSAPKQDTDISWKNQNFKDWYFDFLNAQRSLGLFKNSYFKSTKGYIKYPTNFNFLDKKVRKNVKFLETEVV